MRAVTILSALWAVLLVAALPGARTAAACSCMVPPPPHEALDQAAAVFVGTVVSVALEEGSGYYVVRLRVGQRLKGPQAAELTVRTPSSSAACGYYFREGKAYLIYAHEAEGGLGVSLCSRTARLADARDDVEAFGLDGTDGGDLVGTSGGRCGGPGNAAALQATLFVLIGVLAARRRRR